jgi:molybdate transport system ATP-binding protein
MNRQIKHRQTKYVQVQLKHLALERAGRRVLDDVSWSLLPGQRWVLAGGNGAGKTQLLKIIAGSVWPAPGDSRSPSAVANSSRRYRWRNETFRSPYEVKEEIGYVGPERQDKYERYGWNHSVEQIVGTGLYRTDIPLNPLNAADRRRIDALLSRLAIAPLAQRPFLSLSYGERRLTLLARVLASEPKLLLLDELLSGLDQTNHARALHWLQNTKRAALPWVLATHRVEDVPASATHALVLEKGRVVYRGVLRRAPLHKWLNLAEAPSAAVTKPSKRRRGLLIRLTRASVYLDEHRVLEDLAFEVHSGDCWVIHGHNGSGKTTLLRTLYGDHGVARGGRIERAGIVPGVPLQEFKRRVGIVAPHLQSDHPQALTVSAVVQSGRHASIGLNDAPSAADRLAAQRSLAFFGLADLAARTLAELSYGQMRRVLFARAWACRPSLLLLDEPFSGVDTPTRLSLIAHLTTLVTGGTAVVMTTHHRSEWPACASHELELSHGRAIYCGPVRSSAARSRSTGG